MEPLRIVSLLPAPTEIAEAIGLGPNLVGRSHECDYPPRVRELPVVSLPRIDASAPGPDIDRSGRGLLEQALSIYRVDAVRLRQLAPDVILTQSQCEVCAVSPRDLELALCEWTADKPGILSLSPSTLGGVWHDILK